MVSTERILDPTNHDDSGEKMFAWAEVISGAVIMANVWLRSSTWFASVRVSRIFAKDPSNVNSRGGFG